MGLSISTDYWYGVKFDLNDDDWYAPISELQEKADENDEEMEWEIKIPGERFSKYLTLQQSTYYESVDPLGIGVIIGNLRWGDVIEVDKLSFDLRPELKEAADKLLDELKIPGERKIYVHTVMC